MNKDWVKVKRGLVRDPKHRIAMGECVWLYLWMIDKADFKSGVIPAWQDGPEADELQMAVFTLREQRRKLEKLGYIAVKQSKHHQRIDVSKWKDPRVLNSAVKTTPLERRESAAHPSSSTEIEGVASASCLREVAPIKGEGKGEGNGAAAPSPLSGPGPHVLNTHVSMSHGADTTPALDPFYGVFVDGYYAHYGFTYRDQKGDLDAMRKLRKATGTKLTLAIWSVAVRNYFSSDFGTHSLKEFLANFESFCKHSLDRFKRPKGANGKADTPGQVKGYAAPIPGKYEETEDQ